MTASPLAPGVACPPATPYLAVKRCLDVAVAIVMLVLLAPLLLAITLAVVASSSGPAVFRQPRAGRFGEQFTMWKFRTMVLDAEARRSELIAHSREKAWLALDHDPRVTAVGLLLRRTSLDELPQLVNVVRGEMSFVGPRPLPLAEHANLPAWSALRLEVRPGLTGMWQVMGRSHVPFQEMLRLDCEYVRAVSWWTDLKILARTVPAVLGGRGAN
jgi:lipopolysaccharide/colanic/teichoic acid biosynthesis glycosyltransferase